MKHMKQVNSFYNSLDEQEKMELCIAIAEDIFFLDESLQEAILALLHEAEPEISLRIREINSFTL